MEQGIFIDNKARKHFILIYQLNISNVSNINSVLEREQIHCIYYVSPSIFLYFIYRWLPSKWMSEIAKIQSCQYSWKYKTAVSHHEPVCTGMYNDAECQYRDAISRGIFI